MTKTPILSGQDIGQAHYATRAVLERLLAGTGLEFGVWVTLNLVGGDPALDEDDVLARVAQGLKVDETTARSAVSALVDRGLISRTPPTATQPKITLTPAGSVLRQEALDGIAQITERLYGGLPAEDLAAAHRVLTAVTGRANAELARLR